MKITIVGKGSFSMSIGYLNIRQLYYVYLFISLTGSYVISARYDK